MSFAVIVLIVTIGFLLGFVSSGIFHAKLIEKISADQVELTRKISQAYSERNRQTREANTSRAFAARNPAQAPQLIEKDEAGSVPLYYRLSGFRG